MKHGVSTGFSVSPPLPVHGAHAHPSTLPPVPLPADEPQTTEIIQPGETLFHHTRLNSMHDISFEIRHDHGKAFTDSLFEVSGNIKKSSYTSPKACTS